MSAYATRQREQSARLPQVGTNWSEAEPAAPRAGATLRDQAAVTGPVRHSGAGDWSVIDLMIDRLVDHVAAAVVARLENDNVDRGDEWFDSAEAAEYLGLHRDTLRRLAAARAIPTEQDGRGCKLFFRRSALDEWRRSGGRVRRLAALADAA